MNRTTALAVVLAGCSPPAAPSAPVTRAAEPPTLAPADAGPETAAAPAPPPADAGPAPGGVLLTASGNIDGVDGDEAVELLADGTLRAGALSIRIDRPERNEYFWDKQASLRVVMLDTAKKQAAIHLATPTAEGEDPPSRFQLFVVRRGKLVRAFDQVIGVYNSPEIEFPGDGTLRYLEQGWMACERARHPATVVRQEVVHRLNRAGTAMVAWRRIDTRERQRCDELAACPIVYAVTAAGATRVGEILRDLRGARAYSLQSLPMPRGTTRVRLAEEKPEVTYLDEILVESGGVELRPLACRGDPVPAYCAADGVPFVMRQGDTLDLAFEAGTGDEVALFARGYYVPL